MPSNMAVITLEKYSSYCAGPTACSQLNPSYNWEDHMEATTQNTQLNHSADGYQTISSQPN
ncbi:hypothetical protein PAHAL_5G133700 [Panicum hallii]|uniref:Uncharacterized protein n=1 Tax=Panicum hallii TaxID=206008 RepID=A0A2T8IJZ8_9POAL|nr:hypothetical protein PAHAL_5G133700 [Panicum hallii]